MSSSMLGLTGSLAGQQRWQLFASFNVPLPPTRLVQVPYWQSKIVQGCRRRGKPVIGEAQHGQQAGGASRSSFTLAGALLVQLATSITLTAKLHCPTSCVQWPPTCWKA